MYEIKQKAKSRFGRLSKRKIVLGTLCLLLSVLFATFFLYQAQAAVF